MNGESVYVAQPVVYRRRSVTKGPQILSEQQLIRGALWGKLKVPLFAVHPAGCRILPLLSKHRDRLAAIGTLAAR